ncbi:hypothetical protein [Caloramator proteoclasticus]|uniref:Phage-related protein n=1 Tax=Caloramator proteoclasticus DSM 10124 TaxID=1121262 RepID=A0A1M4ZDU8_9CLOT|nr:hypothetical protein [Caloramator proteoclasticus]SHF16200.1 hypothetical protein SAMN02746091_01892 [Caloramator proteoclasticus DSM 10124]
MATKNILIRGGADFSGVKKELQKTQQQLQSFQNGVSSVMKKIGMVLATIGIGKAIKDATKEAMSFEASFQQIGRIMGANAGEFTKWANSQASALAMSKGELIKYGAVYGNLISGFAKSTGETMQYTQDLLKASSVIASATGRSMEDVMERIRSGLLGNTEAIEDLGVNVNVAMLQSTEAFKKFANGKSWQQLDFQTQQQIRLMAILEQTTKKYGTDLMNNTATAHARFIAELKNLQLALGQAFLPIYQAVLPALTAFIQKITQVFSIIAQFSQALFGKPSEQKQQVVNTQAQSKALGGVAKGYDKVGKAAKKAKGQLAGFDELNTLGKGTSETGSGGAGEGTAGTEIPAMDMNVQPLSNSMVEVSENIKKTVDNIKAKIEEFKAFFEENKVAIISVLSGLAAGFASFWVMSNWGTITAAFQAACTAITTAISSISAPVLAVAALIALLVGNIIYLWQTNEGFRNSVIEIWNSISNFLKTVVSDTWNIIKGIWESYGQTLINNLKGFMTSIQNLILTLWNGYIHPIIKTALETLKWLWDKHLKDTVQVVLQFIMKLVNGALELWNKFFAPIINWLLQNFAPVFRTVFGTLIAVAGTFLAGIADVVKGIFRVLGGLIDFIVGVFTGNWRKAWEGVKAIFKGIFDALYGIIKVPLNLIIDAINFVIKGLNQLLSFKVPSIIPGIGGKQIGVTIPTIPKLARGGIIDSPTVAMIGEAGPEAVVPLQNTGFVQAIGQAVGEAVRSAIGNAKGNTHDTTVVLKLNENELGRAVIKAINNVQRQTGMTLITI